MSCEACHIICERCKTAIKDIALVSVEGYYHPHCYDLKTVVEESQFPEGGKAY